MRNSGSSLILTNIFTSMAKKKKATKAKGKKKAKKAKKHR
jgi:hypothetical protein